MPIVLLAIGALLANGGVGVAKDANAANVVVNATVSSMVTLTPCASPLGIAVAQGGFISGTCSVSYHATNNSALPLLINDSDAAPFLSGGVFANAGAACNTPLAGADLVGYKVATGGSAANNTCATPTAAATNDDYVAVPTGPTTVCTTSATTSQTCPVAIGIFEFGSNANAGTYSGTLAINAA